MRVLFALFLISPSLLLAYCDRGCSNDCPKKPGVSTLQQTLQYAYQTNPALKAQHELVRSAWGQWRSRHGELLPDVFLEADVGHLYEDISAGDASGLDLRMPRGVGITFFQSIFSSGQLNNQAREAMWDYQAERCRYAESLQSLLFEAATSYANLYTAQLVLRLNRHNEKTHLEELEQVRARFEVGDLTITDLSQAESRYTVAIADRIQAEGDLEIQQATFCRVVGFHPDVLLGLEYPEKPDIPLEKAIVLSCEHNFRICAAELNVIARRLGMWKTYGELGPKVDLLAEVTNANDRPASGFQNVNVASSLAFRMPLVRSGRVFGRITSSRADLRRAKNIAEDVARRTREETIIAWNRYATNLARVSAFQEAEQSAGVALDGTRREEREGLRLVVDVLNAEREYFERGLDVVFAGRDTFLAYLDLQVTMGQLMQRICAPQPTNPKMLRSRRVTIEEGGIESPELGKRN